MVEGAPFPNIYIYIYICMYMYIDVNIPLPFHRDFWKGSFHCWTLPHPHPLLPTLGGIL